MMSLIGSGDAIAFVGAGLSVPLGYPGWPTLLPTMETEAEAIAPFVKVPGSLLRRAQMVKDHFIQHHRLSVYHELLGREYGPRPKTNCTGTHKRLVRLPFRAFVTTNYEDCVETALVQHSAEERGSANPGVIIKPSDDDRHRVSLFLRSLTESVRGQRWVAHLHGRHDDTKNIILTEGDYHAAYGISQPGQTARPEKTTLHRHLVWALFATRRLVFLGCSMDDPFVRELLELVATDLWEISTPMHYVILPLDKDSLDSSESTAARFKRFGLQVVYYDNLQSDHAFLDSLLEESDAHGKSITSTQPTADTVPQSSSSRPVAPPETEWLDSVSKRNIPEVKP